MSVVFLFGMVIGLMAIGVPVAMSLGLSSVIFLLTFSDSSLASIAQTLFSAFDGHYTLLAIPFRSYTQPVIVMLAIPFGFVGAVIGHELMGFELSMISSMGLIALAGVVVNDSLVLIDSANGYTRDGKSAFDAIHAAGVRRFRPIMLTSLTTFLGLVPMIMETSAQALFLIPMALSLGFGVLFATFIILLLVPAYYLILDDILRLLGVDRSDDEPARTGDTVVATPAE